MYYYNVLKEQLKFLQGVQNDDLASMEEKIHLSFAIQETAGKLQSYLDERPELEASQAVSRGNQSSEAVPWKDVC